MGLIPTTNKEVSMALWNNSLLPSRRNTGMTSFSDIDQLFDRFRREFFSPDFFRGESEGAFWPKVEVKETEKNLLVNAELPGLNEKDINITLKDNSLIIEGEKKQESKKEEKGYFSSEFSYGSFYRAIPLQADVDADNVTATYKDGILCVTLNKLEESKQKAKRIEIKH